MNEKKELLDFSKCEICNQPKEIINENKEINMVVIYNEKTQKIKIICKECYSNLKQNLGE